MEAANLDPSIVSRTYLERAQQKIPLSIGPRNQYASLHWPNNNLDVVLNKETAQIGKAKKNSDGETDPDEENAALPCDGDGLGNGRDDGLAAGHQHRAAHRRVNEVLLDGATNSSKHQAVRTQNWTQNQETETGPCETWREKEKKQTCMSMTSMAVSLHLAAAMVRRDLAGALGTVAPLPPPENQRRLR